MIQQEEVKKEEPEEPPKKLGPSVMEIARKRQNELDGNVYDNPFTDVDDDPEDNIYEA